MRRDHRHPDRRAVIAAAGALVGVATGAPAAMAASARLDRTAALTLFDPKEPAARAFAEARTGRSVAIDGDRIRLARRLFDKDASSSLRVIARHADVLLLADAAREAGYRALALDPFPAADGHGGLFIWTAWRAPGTGLADKTSGRTVSTIPIKRRSTSPQCLVNDAS